MENNHPAYKIHALDFAILETQLYLDTHPCDQTALAALEKYRCERNEAVAAYEAQCGQYVRTADDVNGDCWSWVKGPWPWEF
ncbi:MAG: spore coat protein CotJB [Clostridia bacterium]|nr:spore coat protein CotJB [Clostridia bacterium]